MYRSMAEGFPRPGRASLLAWIYLFLSFSKEGLLSLVYQILLSQGSAFGYQQHEFEVFNPRMQERGRGRGIFKP